MGILKTSKWSEAWIWLVTVSEDMHQATRTGAGFGGGGASKGQALGLMTESTEAARPKEQALGLMKESAEAARPRGQALGLMKMSAETAPPKGPFDHQSIIPGSCGHVSGGCHL